MQTRESSRLLFVVEVSAAAGSVIMAFGEILSLSGIASIDSLELYTISST